MTFLEKLDRDRVPQTKRRPSGIFGIPIATAVMLAIVLVSGAVVTAWFAGEGRINAIFNQINMLQQQPPIWLEVPMMTTSYLLAPMVVLFLVAFAITKISPEPRPWSRFIVVSILLLLVGRYLLWRSLSTLNLDTPLDGVFSLGLFAMELLGLTGSIIQLVLILRARDRHRQADEMAVAVEEGAYLPSVDVLIPTYDEPAFILRRTIIGCQAMDYPNKTVYLLDDTRRPEIQALAQELGCTYVTRPNNDHAKAGNLNHAIAQTQGELIASFDADFVPTRNFLKRTVGFFQSENTALVQTPQSFYNPDPIARNLGLEDILTPDEEVFYRQIQPMRDGAGSVVCSGTSFVVRRSALQAAGGFVTDSISEDYFTAVQLAAKGYEIIYLDEKLSAGLAAESIAAYAVQRLRWARGTLQSFFIDSNPLTIPGLTLMQRLGHFEGILHWFTSLSRIVFLLMPLAYSFLGVIPIRASITELLYFFLPYYLVQITVFAWLNRHSRSALLSDVYSLVLVFPLAITVLQAMFLPFYGGGFKVTPKGSASDRFNFNWKLAWPLVIIFVLTAFSLWRNLGMCMVKGNWLTTVPPEMESQIRGMGVGWVWSAYNLLMLGITLIILLDIPLLDVYTWFDLRRVVRLRIIDSLGELPTQTWWGITTMISETGAQIAVTQGGLPRLSRGETLPVELEIVEEQLHLRGTLVGDGMDGEFPCVQVSFAPYSLEHQRRLVETLYCRPGQWKRWKTPGELQSLWLMLRILFRARILTRDTQVKVTTVAKT